MRNKVFLDKTQESVRPLQGLQSVTKNLRDWLNLESSNQIQVYKKTAHAQKRNFKECVRFVSTS